MSGSHRKAPPELRPGRRGRRSELERLIDRTVLGPTHPKLGTCWLFTGSTTPYGRIAKAQDSYTHRLGWKLLRGAIPDAMELHHRCGVYACWNPEHLQVVTHAENLAFKRKAPQRRVTTRTTKARDLKPQAMDVALPARFWKKDNKNGPVPSLRPELGPCWLHEGTPEKATGYVRCEINRVRDYVHRFVYRALVEPIPAGKEIEHQCHNADPSCPSDVSCLHRRCANPGHLAAVTHRETWTISPPRTVSRRTARMDIHTTWTTPGSRRMAVMCAEPAIVLRSNGSENGPRPSQDSPVPMDDNLRYVNLPPLSYQRGLVPRRTRSFLGWFRSGSQRL